MFRASPLLIFHYRFLLLFVQESLIHLSFIKCILLLLLFIFDIPLMLLLSILGKILHELPFHLLTIIFSRLQVDRVFSLMRISFVRVQPVAQTLHNVILGLREVRVH